MLILITAHLSLSAILLRCSVYFFFTYSLFHVFSFPSLGVEEVYERRNRAEHEQRCSQNKVNGQSRAYGGKGQWDCLFGKAWGGWDRKRTAETKRHMEL